MRVFLQLFFLSTYHLISLRVKVEIGDEHLNTISVNLSFSLDVNVEVGTFKNLQVNELAKIFILVVKDYKCIYWQ